MSDKRLKEKLHSAVERNVPNVLDNILGQCDSPKGEVVMTEKKKMKPIFKIATAMAAMLVLVVGILGTSNITGLGEVETVIAFDVNPSVEVEVNAHGKVINVKALNEDAKIVVGDMKFRNVDYEIVINAILGSMLRNGYLSTEQNSILVSIHSHDAQKAESLKESIATDVTSILEGSNIEASVIVQGYEKSEEVDKIAKENHISHAKAKLIASIIKAGLTDAEGYEYTYERLAELTVHELQVLLDSKKVELEDVQSSGTASQTKYLGQEKVLELVYVDANITADQVLDVEVNMDVTDGIMVYEIEFFADEYEYEYVVNAITGEILNCVKLEDGAESDSGEAETETPGETEAPSEPEEPSESEEPSEPEEPSKPEEPEKPVGPPTPGEVEKPEPPTPGPGPADKEDPSRIGRGKAKTIALEHMSLKRHEIKELKCDFAEVDGTYVYKVVFVYEGIEYTYIIHVNSGEILNIEQAEVTDDKKPGPGPAEKPGPADTPEGIGQEAALVIAYTNAGVSAEDVMDVKCTDHTHKTVLCYKITFKVGDVEYDYKINRTTGEIVDVVQKTAPEKPGQGPAETPDQKKTHITKEEAQKIVLTDVAKEKHEVKELKCEIKHEKENCYYTVEFKVGDVKFSYKLDAATGDILEKNNVESN